MKHFTLLFFGLVFIFTSCNKQDLPNNTPQCIGDKIEDIADGDGWDPVAKIYSYMYNGEKVYFFPSHCCDVPSMVYDGSCNLVCSPDGGLTGAGDGLCNDFFSTRTDETLIWEDN